MKLLKEWAPLLALAVTLLGALAWFEERLGRRVDELGRRMDGIEGRLNEQGERIARIEGLLGGVRLVLVPEGGPVEGQRYEVRSFAVTAGER